MSELEMDQPEGIKSTEEFAEEPLDSEEAEARASAEAGELEASSPEGGEGPFGEKAAPDLEEETVDGGEVPAEGGELASVETAAETDIDELGRSVESEGATGPAVAMGAQEAELREAADEVGGSDEALESEGMGAEAPAEDEVASAEAALEGEPAVEAGISPLIDQDSDRKWYVVHCYSGYENKVRHNLEQRIETMGMKNKIFDVVVPTEEEMEVKEGKRRTVERRVFPGYILVQMIMDEDSWYVVRNTPGVTGFVGMGNEPTPLRPEEVAQIIRRMEAEAPRIKVTYKIGQKVRIIDGPFNDFIGTVDDIDMERAKVRVMVSFFGRETPVELDFLQVEKA